MSDIITVNDLNLWYGPTQALHRHHIRAGAQHYCPHRPLRLRQVHIS